MHGMITLGCSVGERFTYSIYSRSRGRSAAFWEIYFAVLYYLAKNEKIQHIFCKHNNTYWLIRIGAVFKHAPNFETIVSARAEQRSRSPKRAVPYPTATPAKCCLCLCLSPLLRSAAAAAAAAAATAL